MECPHPPCSCRVTGFGAHCSEACRVGISAGDSCACGHPECEGRADLAPE